MNTIIKTFIIIFMFLFLLSCSSNNNIETSKIIEANNTTKIPNSLVNQENAKQPHFFIDFKLDQAIAEESVNSIYPHFKLTPAFKNKLLGTLYIENTQSDTNIILLALQGRKVTLLSQKGEDDWSRTLIVKSKKNNIISIQVDIKWDQDESDELIIFPFVESFSNFYSGAHSSVIRLFVGDNRDYTFTDQEIEGMKIQKNDDNKLIPELYWIDDDNQRVKTVINNDLPFSPKKYNKLFMTSLNNDTKVDIVYLNTLGESETLFYGYTQEKDKSTVFTIDKIKMEEYSKKNARQFLLVLNNKDDDMIKDLIAVNKGINPISTSFQRIIEIIPFE